jgi:hypothetical protein
MLYLQDGLCYVTEPFHIFKLLFSLVAVSHSDRHYSLVIVIVICYTKSFLFTICRVYLLLLLNVATRNHL